MFFATQVPPTALPPEPRKADRKAAAEPAPKAGKALAEGVAPTAASLAAVQSLSGREMEVARLVAEGLSSKEIASRLDLSVRTVEKHRANIMDKIGVREVASLVRWCIQSGLVKG